jgi:putative tryptophan/tyrosine transport system substrate-binding protein
LISYGADRVGQYRQMADGRQRDYQRGGSETLEMLHELVPTAGSIALLVNPSNSTLTEVETKEAQVAARVLGLRLLVLNATTAGEIEVAFATLVRERAECALSECRTFLSHSKRSLVSLAARHAVPATYGFRETTRVGGLMSYGADISDTFRQVGVYTGRILNGEKPADLPVQNPVRLELVINLKSAKARGLTIPETLLATADEVTVRVWKMRPELQAHWRIGIQEGCGLPVATGRQS